MLKWNGRRLALPAFCVWALFFAPPVFLQAYYGSWTALGYLIVYPAISCVLGVCSLIAVVVYFPVDAEKVSDE